MDQVDNRAANAAGEMLRTTQQHHVQLSALADVKASILITATSIVITAAVALGSIDPIQWSLVALLVGATIALGSALLAVLPRHGAAPPKPGQSGFNLLFFGHFTQISEDEYVDEVGKVITDYDAIMEKRSRDIYGIGAYLHRTKYRYLRVAYLSFLAGTVSAAVIELLGRVLS